MARTVTPLMTVAVLAWLAEGPAHAYSLKKHIEMGLGSFMAISDGSLYPLLRDLETHGSITSHIESAEPGRPDRVVYAITDAGLCDLRQRLALPLASGPSAQIDFYVRVVCFSHLEPAGRLALIGERRATLERERTALEASRSRMVDLGGHLDLADLRTRQVQAELEWLDGLEHRLE